MPALVPSPWTTPGLAPSVPYLFGVASIDDDVALGGGSHLTARPWSRPHPCRSQLAPGEGVQVEGVHIIVVDEISAESTFGDGDMQDRIKSTSEPPLQVFLQDKDLRRFRGQECRIELWLQGWAAPPCCNDFCHT